MRKLLLFSLGFIAFTSCHRYYTNNNIKQYPVKSVAILPVEMIYTGNLPKNMKAEDIAKIEEEESRMFQQSLYSNLINFAGSRKKPSEVNFQPMSKTLQLLAENNISVRDSWAKDPDQLAKLLGVDGVIRTRVTKNRYMSDLASAGVSVVNEVLNAIGRNNNAVTPNGNARTNDIIASCSLMSNGVTLWNDNYKRGTDWNTPTMDVVENITRNFGRRFPL
jgi:hypothetical protein